MFNINSSHTNTYSCDTYVVVTVLSPLPHPYIRKKTVTNESARTHTDIYVQMKTYLRAYVCIYHLSKTPLRNLTL